MSAASGEGSSVADGTPTSTAPAGAATSSPPVDGGYAFDATDVEIRDVWADNLDAEMEIVRRLAARYRYIAMDTEFPGIVARPLQRMETAAFYYENVRINVDLLKIIQLGVTFTDDEGRPVEGGCCFQFNFQFDVDEDMQARESIDLLRRSGIQFDRHRTHGINLHRFGELLISSGLVLTDEVTWVSFHGGYDFGYLLKVLTCLPLPAQASQFFEKLRIYFPSFVDVKHLTDSVGKTAVGSVPSHLGKLGLTKLGNLLQLPRIGSVHTAGSDSLLTAFAYFKLKRLHFNNNGDEASGANRDILSPVYHNILHGLNDRGPGGK
jgi:CCR4-NOT transcription complex subunit 7/8